PSAAASRCPVFTLPRKDEASNLFPEKSVYYFSGERPGRTARTEGPDGGPGRRSPDGGCGLGPAGGYGVGQRGVVADGLIRVAGAEVGHRLLEPGRTAQVRGDREPVAGPGVGPGQRPA